MKRQGSPLPKGPLKGEVRSPARSSMARFSMPEWVATWMVATGMTNHPHAFDACEGDSLRISTSITAISARASRCITRRLRFVACCHAK